MQDEHRRLPAKLVVGYRQGCGSNPRSKSGAVPGEVQGWLAQQLAAGQPHAEQQLQRLGRQVEAAEAAAPAGAVVAESLALLRPAVAASGWQLTRLAVGLAYDVGAEQQAALPTGQRSLAGFVQRQASKQLEAAAADDDDDAVAAGHQAPQVEPQQAHHHQHQQQEPQQHHVPQQPSKPPAAAARPVSYRNAEAVALQRLFAGCSASASQLDASLAGMSPEDRASLELALRLQQEEAGQAGAAGHATALRKRGPPAARAPLRGKLQRGPLDAFVRRGGV